MRCGLMPKAVAAPATVSGERRANCHWDHPGRRRDARTREPGDLPSHVTGPGGAPRSHRSRRPPGRVPSAVAAPHGCSGGETNGRMRDVVIHVCVTCRREGDAPDAPRQGAALHAGVAALARPGLRVAGVECLGNCKRGCSVAVRAEASWTYVFGDLTADSACDV